MFSCFRKNKKKSDKTKSDKKKSDKYDPRRYNHVPLAYNDPRAFNPRPSIPRRQSPILNSSRAHLQLLMMTL